jgi:NAD(P)-dependent dehydrogenase (short-subunit alcohol dehydrogenase family)
MNTQKVAVLTGASQGIGAGVVAAVSHARMGEVSDVVAGIVYLEDSPFVTGEVLHIDGGQNVGH